MSSDYGIIGNRLRVLRRRRGFTQEQLAEVSGVDVSTVRKLEQGTRAAGRVATLHALARALNVSTSALFEAGLPAPTNVADDARKLDLMSLRSALTPAPGSDAPTAVPDVNHLIATLTDAERNVHEGAYGAALPLLPELIIGARAAQPDGGSLLSRSLHLTGWMLTQLHALDLAYYPLAEATASTPAEATVTLSWLLIRQGRFDEAERAAVTMADRVEPKLSTATDLELSTWAFLLMRGSAAAARNNRPDEAADMLRLADAGTARLHPDRIPGPLPPYGVASRRLVSVKAVENAAVAGQPARVLRMADRVPNHRGYVSLANYYRHRLDVATAYVRQRRYNDGFDVLREIRRAAPEWLAYQRYARNTLQTILDTRRRPVTEEMREMADSLGIG